jgi:hypothetical protein
LEEFAVGHGYSPVTDKERQYIDEQVRRAAYQIIASFFEALAKPGKVLKFQCHCSLWIARRSIEAG